MLTKAELDAEVLQQQKSSNKQQEKLAKKNLQEESLTGKSLTDILDKEATLAKPEVPLKVNNASEPEQAPKQETVWNNIQAIVKTEESSDPKLIENWLGEEGFKIHKHSKHNREEYKFKYEIQNEKHTREFVMEVSNFGKEIKKIKMRII